MAKRVSVDSWLFTVTLILVFLGLVMVFSASAVMAKERYGSGYYFLLRQVGWAAGGIVAMVVAMKVDYRRYKHPGVVFSMLGVTTLMLISVFFLDRAHNTHRWIHFSGFSFQPSEVAKVAVILFLAFFLESRINSMNDVRNTVLPAVLPTVMFLGLIVLQPDLGTAIACAAITACMLFVAGLDLRYLGYGFGLSLIPLYFLVARVAWRWGRITAFLNPYSDPQGKGFHIIQSLAEVVLSSRAAHRFYFCRHRGRARPAGVAGSSAAFRDLPMAWSSHRAPHSGCVRPPAGCRNHQHGGGAGLHQYERGVGAYADQGDPAAVCILRRLVAVCDSGLRGSPAEHH